MLPIFSYICTCSLMVRFWNISPKKKMSHFVFQLVYLFLSSIASITIAGLGNWHNRKRKKLFTICKITGATYVLMSCVSSRSFFHLHPIFPQDAFQCFQDLKRIYLVCYHLLSSHCNAHAVNDSVLTGWLIGGNFKEKNNHGACFTFHQSNYLKNTHKRDWSLPHFCLIPSSDFSMFSSSQKFRSPVSIILRISQFAETLLECLFVLRLEDFYLSIFIYLWLFF